MNPFTCHLCDEEIPEGGELWLAPADGRADEEDGEPHCPECAGPVGLAA